jgi:hypothetical protein
MTAFSFGASDAEAVDAEAAADAAVAVDDWAPSVLALPQPANIDKDTTTGRTILKIFLPFIFSILSEFHYYASFYMPFRMIE